MNTATQTVQTDGQNSAENTPLRESQSSEGQGNGRIISVAFTGATTRKRECLNPPPRRIPNSQRRSREYLTESEVERLIKAAEGLGRHGHRDGTLILVAYRHALRVGELISLRWDQADLAQGLLHVRRLKNGTPSTHPLQGPTIRALRRIQREYPNSPYIFAGERKGPLSASAVRKIVARAGQVAGIEFSTHPHMLRHGAGFYLANQGIDTRSIQHYLGHRNISHTVTYTQLSPDRFKEFWKD